jgi:hypothetical protein
MDGIGNNLWKVHERDGGVRKSCGDDNLNMNLTSTVFVIEVYLNYHVCLNVTGLVLLLFVYMPGIMAYVACCSIACNVIE